MRSMIAVILISQCVLFHASNATAAYAKVEIDEKKIDQLVVDGMREHHIPGLSLGVIYRDQLVFLKGYGTADDDGRHVTPRTPFILGSTSKSFTALAIMQLVEQGEIELDAEVERYLTWLQFEDPSGRRQVTVRDLLNQTSGISTYAGRKILSEEPRSLEEPVRSQTILKLNEPVGTVFQYSNLNYVILGEIIQRVTGMSFEQYIEDRIFKPLDMISSYADKSVAMEHGLASGYQSIFGRLTTTNPKIQSALVPAGYIISSAEDMTHYLLAQMNGGNYRKTSLISSAGMQLMHTPSSVFPYGMGWFADSRMISHGGDAENFHSDLLLLPESGWGVVSLMNTNDALKTTLDGSVYTQLSMHILNVISNGELFPSSMLLPTQSSNYDGYILIILSLAIAWILWAIYRVIKGKREYPKTTLGCFIVNLSTIILYFLIPLAVLWRLPAIAMAPWGIIVRFIPGVGHALLIIPILLLLIGSAKVIIGIQQMRRAYRSRRWTA
ncbi:serine hydrolase domain-containing protein [Paenibacillus guangzhouensis]|uniref:serine hydrolase domain-containing protein n=1 Tax=Paenibacillus guangzhouensis TaxID=1473112 RepID=UPI0012668B04|nr:serine hydrolase domain-containing protein [Paenibacillus guangzhouensis]